MTGYYSGDDLGEFVDDEDFSSCDYGAEFCEDPQTRAMGLCTTECRTYFQMVREQDEEVGWQKVLRSEGKCGSCGGSLAEGFINCVMLDKYATWKFPAWGNILGQDEDKQQARRATTFICDDCVKLKQMGRGSPVKWAVEIYQEEDEEYKLRYHDVEQLEDSEPITEEDLE